ncbi:hypothetical protein V3851_04250 [Paenibacillus sp. M1]|uniref:Phage tail tape measure protein n=1 Tax=Paenibacillus haidiansis TaxID=1574488 RepID=A0ABU7VMN2_9BACL
MAETIRGINVVIGAETTGLSKALSDVNKKSRDIQSELREVEKLLKLDPGNTELLAQKQKLLGDAVENTSEKLNRLRAAQQQVNEQFAKGEISEGQYRAFQREIAKTEQQLSGFEGKLKKTGPAFKELGKEAESAASKIKKAGEGIKSAGEKMSVGITAPLAGIAALATEGTKELREDMAKLETNAIAAGAGLDTTKDALRDLNAITGETDSNVEALSNILQAGFKDSQMEQVLESLSGAVIKFPDTLKIEGLADGLQETLATGKAIGPFAELLERMGLNLDTFNVGLAEANKNGTTQQYVLDTLAKTGLAEVNRLYQENNKELVENANAQWDLQQALAELGKLIQPILSAVTQKIADLLNWFNSLDAGTKNVILTIAGIAAAIGPLLVIIGQVVSSVSALAPVFSALASPIGLIIAAIAALAAGLIYLYNNNETVRNALNAAWEWLKSAAEGIFNAIKEFWAQWGDEIMAFFKTTWEVIKTVFKTVFEVISTIVTTVFEGIKAFWDKWGATITETFKNVFEILKIVFSTVFDVIFTVVKTIFNAIKAFWDTWGDTIITQFKAAFGIVKAVFEGAWNSIKIVVETVIGVISGIVKTWLAIFKGDWEGAWEGVKETVKAIWDGITGLFSNAFETMKNIGKNIIDGLINGIKSMKDAVVNTAKDIANGIGDSVKDFFGIHSPSRLMLGYGKNIVQGLANGISQTASQAVRSASAISAAVSDAMTFNVGGISSAANSALSGSGTVSGTNQTNVSLADMFRGANFVVRSDNDIKLIAQGIGGMFTQKSRALGGA